MLMISLARRAFNLFYSQDAATYDDARQYVSALRYSSSSRLRPNFPQLADIQAESSYDFTANGLGNLIDSQSTLLSQRWPCHRRFQIPLPA